MTREEVLKEKVDRLNEQQNQIKVRIYREQKKKEVLEQKSRGFRKERTHRLITLGAELEYLAGRELSIEDVNIIYTAAMAHREPSPGETLTGTPSAK